MSKIYMELICDEDVANELMAYPDDRVDVICWSDDKDRIKEIGGDKYKEE